MQKKSVLITCYNLEIGGIERSLIGLLENFDYGAYDVDLLLYNRHGPFLASLPQAVNLLPEIPAYANAFRNPLMRVVREGHFLLTAARVAAKLSIKLYGYRKNTHDESYLHGQRFWKYILPLLPRIEKPYDVALSFAGPHYCVSNLVDAKVKLGWLHSDYSELAIDESEELKMSTGLNYLVAVSEECRRIYIKRFPLLAEKTIVIENILCGELVRRQASEFNIDSDMPKEHGVTRILSIGRFTYQKGFDDAVCACRILIDLGYRIRWYLIGFGPDDSILRQLIAQNRLENRFIILGTKPNPYPYIFGCDIYVQPSRYEGKAVTVREAQMLARPVLITRFATSASQVEEGVDGHICTLGVDGIVDGVRRLVDDDQYKNSLALNAAARNYDNKKEVTKLCSIIQNHSI